MSVKLGDGMRWIGLSTTDTEFALLNWKLSRTLLKRIKASLLGEKKEKYNMLSLSLFRRIQFDFDQRVLYDYTCSSRSRSVLLFVCIHPTLFLYHGPSSL